MSNQMPDAITRILLAALNAADDMVERNIEFAEPVGAELLPAAEALADLTRMQTLDIPDNRQDRFAATIRLSMDKFRSAS